MVTCQQLILCCSFSYRRPRRRIGRRRYVRLSRAHIVITDASGGTGRALVALFGQSGASITAISRDMASLDQPVIRDQLLVDLTDVATLRSTVAKLASRRGATDVVVSNAGYTRAESLDDLDDVAFEWELAIDLTGAYRVTDALLTGTKAHGGSAIVAVASVNALAHYGNPACAPATCVSCPTLSAGRVRVDRSCRGVAATRRCRQQIRPATSD